jgi:hypothetical protein
MYSSYKEHETLVYSFSVFRKTTFNARQAIIKKRHSPYGVCPKFKKKFPLDTLISIITPNKINCKRLAISTIIPSISKWLKRTGFSRIVARYLRNDIYDVSISVYREFLFYLLQWIHIDIGHFSLEQSHPLHLGQSR